MTGSDLNGLVRISSPYSNDSISTALLCHRKLLKKLSGNDPVDTRPIRENLYGGSVKMISKHTLNNRLLSSAERDEVVEKYKSGMNMTAIAKEYGCHYTTVGRILRRRGITIRL